MKFHGRTESFDRQEHGYIAIRILGLLTIYPFKMQSFRSLLRKPIANVAGGVLTKVSAPAIVSVMRNVQYGAVSSTYSQPVR